MQAILTILTLTIFTLSSAQNWQAVNSNTTEDLNDIFFISENEGYMVSETGSIFRTDDAGDNWEGIYSNLEIRLVNVFCLQQLEETDFTLIAFGYQNSEPLQIIANPSSSQINWSIENVNFYPIKMELGMNNAIYYNDSFYLNKLLHNESVIITDNLGYFGVNGNEIIYVNRIFNQLYKSTDNALIFEQLNNYPSGFNANQSNFAKMKSFGDTLIIHYTYPNNTVYSLDNGDNWTYLPDGEHGVNYCEIINETTLFGAGLPETHLNVQHNFQPWEPNFVMPEKIRKIYFYNNDLGFVLGENGMIYKTTNMGGLLGTTEVEEVKNEISIHPNPVTNILTIETQEDIKEVRVFDASGKLVQRDNSGSSKFHLSGLTKGVYVLKIKTDEQVYSEKFIKK